MQLILLYLKLLYHCLGKKKFHDINLAFLKVNAIASYRKAAAIKEIEREFMLLSFILDSSLAVWQKFVMAIIYHWIVTVRVHVE